MATNTKSERPSKYGIPVSWRPSSEDKKLIQELKGKLGVSTPDVIRLGIRALAKQELLPPPKPLC